MTLGRVQGEIVATIKHPGYEARRLLMVDRIDADGRELGSYLIAVATVDAGVGDMVLILDEGSSARQILGNAELPIRAVVIGVVDDVHSSPATAS